MTDVAEQEIRTMITAYVKDTRTAWIAKDLFAVERNWNKYAADKSVIMIRPSGNPLTFDGVKGNLRSIDTIRLFCGAKAAVVTFTCRDVFEYKGTPNDDICKFSIVLEKIGDDWKMVHGHRATGQKPKN